LGVVDAVAARLGRVDIVEGERHAIVHLIRAAAGSGPGRIVQGDGMYGLELRADGQFFDHELKS
jgi:hypothetical protein